MTEYTYTFIKGTEYIVVRGTGEDPSDLKISWSSSPYAAGVLKQMLEQVSGYSPMVGFVQYDNYQNDIYVQIARFGSIYKDGWRFKSTNLPEVKN